VAGTVSDPADLSATMAASAQAQACMVQLWYRHAVRRDLLSNGSDTEHVLDIVNAWAGSDNQSLRALLRLIVADENFARLLP